MYNKTNKLAASLYFIRALSCLNLITLLFIVSTQKYFSK